MSGDERQIIKTQNFEKNEILHNFVQSLNILLKKLIVIVKYQDGFHIRIASNYRDKTILQIAARQIVVCH